MVAEHVAWFEDFGSGTLRHELTVESSDEQNRER